MYKEWLRTQISVEEAEEKYLDQDDRIGPAPVPFGYFNPLWEKLKSNMKEGDEIWQFSSPKETWLNMCGRGGICIVRDGEVFKSMVTVMN